MSLFYSEENLVNSLKRLHKFLGVFNVEHVLAELLSEQSLPQLLLWLKVWCSLWLFIVTKGNKLLEQYMQNQNLSEPANFIISATIKFKLLYFKWAMLRNNEYSIKFLQLNNLLHVLQVTLTAIRPKKLKKRKKER